MVGTTFADLCDDVRAAKKRRRDCWTTYKEADKALSAASEALHDAERKLGEFIGRQTDVQP